MNPRQKELLDILKEEASEVVQAASKVTRFGAHNQRDLEIEIGDFFGVLKLLYEEGYVNLDRIEEDAEAKIIKLQTNMTNPRNKETLS